MLTDLENTSVERKPSSSDMEKIRRTICAFANDITDERRTAILFVGVSDDGIPNGLSIDDKLVQLLSQPALDGSILPFPDMEVGRRRLCGGDVAIICVKPSQSTPVCYKNVVWVRTGSSSHRASREQEMRLAEKRRGRDLPFDVRENSAASLDDLLVNLFENEYLPRAVDEETLSENQRSLNQKLLALHMIGPDQKKPTNLALLLFGKEPTYFIPGASIRFVRIEGFDLSDPIKDSKELQGPLIESLRDLDTLLKLNISTSVDLVSEPTEVRHPDYPLVALQQLTRNAVLHRDYETSNAPVQIYWFADRVEIHSPGGPFGRVTRDNFGSPGVTDYRNRSLAQAMKTLGYVQSFGVGITKAKVECKKNGNPEPEFQVQPTTILVTIKTSGGQP
jgi:ATP-dependent DNA helicase RecG